MAALVTGIVGAVVLSVILGVVALRQIARRDERGSGLAVGGLVASAVWSVVLVVGLIAFTGADTEDSGDVAGARDLPVEELRLGDCLDDVRESSRVFTVSVVPCSEPHEGQVYAVSDLPDAPWPGEEEVLVLSEERCLDQLERDFPETYDDLSVEVFFFHPTRGSWRFGDRQVLCVAQYLDGGRTGSLFD